MFSVNKNKFHRKIIFLFRECGVYLQSKPNDMTQTPLTKAIKQLSQYRDNHNKMCDTNMIDICIDKLTDLLPYEREVIEGAYNQGSSDEIVDNEFQQFESSSDYFTKTFTNNAD